MADRLGIDTGQDFFEKLRVYENAVLKIWNKDKKGKGDIVCDDKRRARCKAEFGEFLKWTCENCPSNPQSGPVEDEGRGKENQSD